MKTISRITNKVSAAALMTVAIISFGTIKAEAADTGVKGNPPYVWPQVKTKEDADAVKLGDSIAMVCAKCKTISVTLVTQDTKTKLIPGEKHLCAGCNSTITVVGSNRSSFPPVPSGPNGHGFSYHPNVGGLCRTNGEGRRDVPPRRTIFQR